MKKTTARIITTVIALVLLFSCVFALCACDEKEENTAVFKSDTRYAVDYENLNMMDKKKVGYALSSALNK